MVVGSVSPRASRSRHRSHSASMLPGSQPNGQSATTSISGSSAARARAAVDFAVPRSPRISTPPICEEMAFRMSARFILLLPDDGGKWIGSQVSQRVAP